MITANDPPSNGAKNTLNKIINNGWFILGCNICSVVGLIVSLASDDPICKRIIAAFTSLFIFSIAFYMFYRVFNINRARRNIYRTLLAINKKTFSCLHAFNRDLLNYLSMLRKNNNPSIVTFRDKAALLCNRIEQIFTAALSTTEPVSVCIKFIKTDSILDADIMDAEVYTFARSSSTQSSRLMLDMKNNPPDKIIENSDFEMIVSDERLFRNIEFFACENLDAYPDAYMKEYKKTFTNSHQNPPYKSTIVVPIRTNIENVSERLKHQSKSTNCYHIVGFLCIDSEEIFVTSEDHRFTRFKNTVELAQSIADSLYPFLEEYLIKSL